MKEALRVGVGMVFRAGWLTYSPIDGDCTSLWENAVFNDSLVHREILDVLYDRMDNILHENNRLRL